MTPSGALAVWWSRFGLKGRGQQPPCHARPAGHRPRRGRTSRGDRPRENVRRKEPPVGLSTFRGDHATTSGTNWSKVSWAARRGLARWPSHADARRSCSCRGPRVALRRRPGFARPRSAISTCTSRRRWSARSRTTPVIRSVDEPGFPRRAPPSRAPWSNRRRVGPLPLHGGEGSNTRSAADGRSRGPG